MDHNFVTDSRKRFEQYYPGQNTFVVYKQTSELEMIKNPEGFIVMNSNGATLAEESHPYAMLWLLAGIYFITAVVMTRYLYPTRQRRLRTA